MPGLKLSWENQIRRFTETHRKQSVRNFSWMMMGQGLGYFFQAVYFVLLTRLLGSLEYGIFVGAFAFTSLLAPYSSLGMGTVFLRYASAVPELFAPYWGNILMASLSLSGVIVAALVVLSSHILDPASARLVLMAAIANCFCTQLVMECGRVFQAAEKMRVTALLNLLTNAGRVITALGMLLLLHRASAYQWTVASVIVSVLSALAAVITVMVTFGAPKFSPSLLKKRAWEGFGFSFATSSSSVYNDVDKTLLSHYGMNRANGIYTTAYRIIDFATMPLYALRDAMIPKLFQAARDGIEPAAALGYRLLKRSLLLNLVIFILLLVTAPILPMIVGRGFAGSVSAVRWLALIPVLRSIHQMTGTVLLAAGYQKYRTATQLVAAGFNFLINLWLIPHFGWLGAAWASLATDGSLALANWVTLEVLRRSQRNAKLSLQAIPVEGTDR
jgi:O-antigen/teichoic acid export membrane protein